ncbi:hypothetical protein HGH92_21190 [Chitinophaga varians]|uniref:Glycosyltransferase RgtA/B/C/D-like domain-containing protein n=1 Tax=Chitinophaga varians TaxID=2202339 RepID=A0A847S1U9_9BACT|nr:hypothetical protein [Chitinophaga varians]NLR66837.1 hypothetical protein [Chitinophaga varians]
MITREKLAIDNKNKSDIRDISFRDFVLQTKIYRIAIAVCFLAMIVQLFVFKYFYPYPSFINGDSYEYLKSAFYNLKINTYPIGYAKFLRLFSVFFIGGDSLVVFQYFFTQFSILWLMFSVFYFYNPNKIIQMTLLGVMVTSPIFLYLANYISSDSLFLGLSICWFTTLIWILNRPSYRLWVFHSIFVCMAFIVRYNALYYPLISLVVVVLDRRNISLKVVGLVLMFGLIGMFVVFTSLQYKKLTGRIQFSPFSGWQMANNAMYAYKFVDPAKRKELPLKFHGLDKDVRAYFDTTRPFLNKFPEEMLWVSTIYMWKPTSPLRIYMNRMHVGDTTFSEFRKWSEVAPLYNEYGIELMKTYPGVFVRMYLWPNLIKFYVPPVEFLSSYGYRVDSIPPVAMAWFDYKHNKAKTRFKDNHVSILEWYPNICGIMNAVFIMLSVSFFVLKGRRLDRKIFLLWIMYFLFWMTNIVFSVFASPIALRFQIFPLVLCTAINFVLLDFVLKGSGDQREETIKSDNQEVSI